MARLPTVDDVAALAGVSRQTVSNVLNSPVVVRPATRTRVESAIEQLGYRPHASARRLRSRKSFTIGIRLDPVRNGISGNILDRFLHAITEQADDRGMRILLYTAADPADEIGRLRELRDGADVDAVVLTSTFYDDPRTAWLTENRVPFVTFGRPWGEDDMDAAPHLWVDVDGFAGVRDATLELRARGATRVGFIGWPSPSGTGDERRRGWADASGVEPLEHSPLSRAVEDGVAQGTRAAAELLAGTGAPDALVCASDSLALGAAIAVAASDRPGLPVVGYDNTPVALAVGLSSVDQPVEAVAAAALELLFGGSGNDILPRDAGPQHPRHHLLAPRLVLRGRTPLAPNPPTTG
jgi:DNA-binding LacI/PurR family transcriptional regulator